MFYSARHIGRREARGSQPLRESVGRRQPWIVAAMAFAMVSPAGVAFGQELEEILVTAERREDRLINEPTSISVVEGSFMRQQHISDFQELGNYVPNVRFDVGGGGLATSAAGMRPNIRGFSTSPRIQSMESPVGLAVNGVAYNRLEYFETAFFDVDRVQVLRGPQGIVFGKNTSVGLLSVTTNKPTDTSTGYVDFEVGELGRRRAEAAVGGPLTAGVNFRIAGLTDERDGFMKNTTAETDPRASGTLGSHKRRGVRTQIEFPDLNGADLLVSYEHFDIRGEGLATELRRASDNVTALFRQFDANADVEPGNQVTSIAGDFSRRVVLDTFRADVTYDLAGWGLQGVAGYSILDARRGGDIQPQPAGGWYTVFTEDTKDLTLEGLVTSPDFGSFSITGGVFYQRSRTDPIASEINFAQRHIFDLLGSVAPPAPAELPRPPYNPGAPAGPYPVCCDGIEEIDRIVEQDNDAFAILAQVHWTPVDRLTITGGLRLSWEDKDARLVQINSNPAFLTELTGTLELDQNFSRSESHTSPRIALTYDWTDDVRIYASRTEGFRSGGFSSLLSNPEAADLLEFDDESISSWEAGARVNLPNQNLSLNVALFNMKLTDYQLNTQVQVGVFNPPAVVNVGKVRARGLEADVAWNPTDWLSVMGTLGFNDTDLVEFPAGPCARDRPNIDGDADSRCDLSGKRLPRSPKFALSLTPRVTFPLVNNGTELFGGFTLQWTDSQFLAETLDPRSREPSFFWLDVDIGIAHPTQGWTITLAAQNLTDESVATVVEEIGLTLDTYVQTVRPPRQVFVGVRWDF